MTPEEQARKLLILLDSYHQGDGSTRLKKSERAIAAALRTARREEREWTAMAGAEVFSKEIDGLGAFELIEMADKIEAHASARAQEQP